MFEGVTAPDCRAVASGQAWLLAPDRLIRTSSGFRLPVRLAWAILHINGIDDGNGRGIIRWPGGASYGGDGEIKEDLAEQRRLANVAN